MIKKIILSIALLIFVISLTGCGGGSGSSSVPVGVNPSIAALVQLLPVQYVVHTNSFITFKAKVIDGNGRVMQNVPVAFTNLSLTGVLSSISANTDAIGIATVTLYSTTDGFATVQAEVYTGSGQVRDKKTVFFTSSSSLSLLPSMTLDVDGDGDGIYNEASDFELFENTNDSQVLVRATLYNSFGQLVFGDTVTFTADVPYRVGADPAATCSDGSAICEVSFPLGNTATTDSDGQAFVLVSVSPATLRNVTTVLNIMASATNGAFNMVSVFLNPVTINSIVLGPSTVFLDSEGTVDMSATVFTTAGGLAPDGTAVNFSTTGTAGSIVPFAQVTTGVAGATFTASTVTPSTATASGTIQATSGGVTSNVVPVTVNGVD